MIKRTWCVIAFAAAVPMLSAAPGNLKLGMVEVHPYATIGVASDNNIYLDPTDPKSAVIITFTPGVRFAYPGKVVKASLDLNADVIGYSYNPSSNNALHQAADLQVSVASPAGFRLSLVNRFKNTTDPAYSELVERAKRMQDDLAIEATYDIGGTFIAGAEAALGNYSYEKQSYQLMLGRMDLRYGLLAGYRLSGKTALTAGVSFGGIDYAEPANLRDSGYLLMQLKVTGMLTPKTQGILAVGQHARTYKDLSGKDFSAPVISLQSATKFSDKTVLDLGISRTVYESIFLNNSHYIALGLDAALRQTVDRLVIALKAGYQSDAYPEENTVGSVTAKRSDTIITMGVGLRYAVLPWLGAELGYTMRNRDSNFNAYDYADTLIGLSVKAAY